MQKERKTKQNMKLVYTSRTGNVEKLVNEINTSNTLKIETGKEVLDEAAVLVTYTDGAGILPETVRSFLDANKGKVRYAAVSGNHVKHPTTFTGAADILEKEYGIPVIARFDLAGSEAVVKAVKAALSEDKDDVAKLNRLLASQEVFTANLQLYHWYITGKQFFTLHPQLEDLYDAMRDDFDKTAELILTLNGAPASTLSSFTNNSVVAEANPAWINADDTLKSLKDGYLSLITLVSSIKSETENELVSIALDDMLKAYEKNVWMVSQAQA